MIKKFLYRLFLPKMLSKACESTIPRPGEEMAKVDCFIVALDRAELPYFVANEIAGDKLVGLKWNGKSYADKHSINISELEKGEFRVTHHYGLTEIVYESIYDIAWNLITKQVYAQIIIHRRVNAANQYFFNKKKLATKKRTELLRFMMDDQIDRDHDGIGLIELMTEIYSDKWFFHPTADRQEKKLELQLDSLIDSGEIKKVGTDYIVTDKATGTIEKHEEEERRHTETVKPQKIIISLTILIILITIYQAL